jgi:opacity protein-like surface antigen
MVYARESTQSKFEIKASNMLSLYIEPGLSIFDKTLIYGKLSHESMKYDHPAFGSNPSLSKRIEGFGFGAGIRTMIDGNKFIQIEFRKINYRKFAYDAESNFKNSALIGSFGMGIKF